MELLSVFPGASRGVRDWMDGEEAGPLGERPVLRTRKRRLRAERVANRPVESANA